MVSQLAMASYVVKIIPGAEKNRLIETRKSLSTFNGFEGARAPSEQKKLKVHHLAAKSTTSKWHNPPLNTF